MDSEALEKLCDDEFQKAWSEVASHPWAENMRPFKAQMYVLWLKAWAVARSIPETKEPS